MNSSNHRPIALHLHLRNVIEKVLYNGIRSEYELHASQLGFRRHQGTEIAILRSLPSPTLRDDCIAILDLKQAYPSIPKEKLLERCREELKPNLCDQLEHVLKPTSFQTVGDDSKAGGTFNRGVPQRSVASPSLYNVFIDSFPRSVIAEEPSSNCPVIIFVGIG